jgi:ABC-type sugar transport system substrate-binding protein
MKKKVLFIALAIVMVFSLSMAGCNSSGSGDTTGDAGATPETQDEAAANTEDGGAAKYKFTVVVQAISGDFTNSFKKGAEDAANVLGVEVNVTGPEEQVIADEVSIVETSLEGDIDGIAVVAGDSEGFRNAKATADSKGIPFVTFNMDDGNEANPGEHPGYGIGYAGAVEYNFAKLFAEKFFNDIAPDVKNYLIATADPNLPVCIERAQAIRDVAKAKGGIEELETVAIGYDFNEGYGVVENALTANPNVEAIVGTDHFSQSIANVVGDQGLGDKIMVGCFDPLPGTIARLETGDCDLIADQNPYLMAYYSIVNLYLLKENGSCAYNIDTGAYMWTQDQIEDLKIKYDYEG